MRAPLIEMNSWLSETNALDAETGPRMPENVRDERVCVIRASRQ